MSLSNESSLTIVACWLNSVKNEFSWFVMEIKRYVNPPSYPKNSVKVFVSVSLCCFSKTEK